MRYAYTREFSLPCCYKGEVEDVVYYGGATLLTCSKCKRSYTIRLVIIDGKPHLEVQEIK